MDQTTGDEIVSYVTKVETAKHDDWAQDGMKIFPSERSQLNFVDSEKPMKPVAIAGTVTAAGYAPATFGPLTWNGREDLCIEVPLTPFV